MKRIGIDARLAFQTGVGVYLRNFLYFLQRLELPKDWEFYIYLLKKDAGKVDIYHPQMTKHEVTSKWHSFDEQLTFYQVLMQDNLDLMHFTYFSYPVRYKRPFIATIHDTTPLLFKTGKATTLPRWMYEIKFQSFKYVISEQIKQAKTVITPTKSVKKQLGLLYGSAIEKKIVPIYEGVNQEMISVEENSSLRKQYPDGYLLYVGNFYPHKNVNLLLDAYELLEEKVPLVLLGPDNYFAGKLKKRVEDEKISQVTFHHGAQIADIIYFYKHARALINPSLSEGFGLPLIEAAYFGTPIIASNLPVFNELYEDTYLSFDPTSMEDLAQKLAEVIRKKPVVDYSAILKKFSFEKMTHQIFQEYKKLL